MKHTKREALALKSWMKKVTLAAVAYRRGDFELAAQFEQQAEARRQEYVLICQGK